MTAYIYPPPIKCQKMIYAKIIALNYYRNFVNLPLGRRRFEERIKSFTNGRDSHAARGVSLCEIWSWSGAGLMESGLRVVAVTSLGPEGKQLLRRSSSARVW
jgi:hypothetical protein